MQSNRFFSIEWLAIQRKNSHVQRTRLCKQSGERMIYINSNQRLIGYMDAETKWPPFSRHFQVNFLEWHFMNFHWNFTEVCLKGPINTIPALVQIMAWCRSCAKTLSEPIMGLVYWSMYASLGLNELNILEMGNACRKMAVHYNYGDTTGLVCLFHKNSKFGNDDPSLGTVVFTDNWLQLWPNQIRIMLCSIPCFNRNGVSRILYTVIDRAGTRCFLKQSNV